MFAYNDHPDHDLDDLASGYVPLEVVTGRVRDHEPCPHCDGAVDLVTGIAWRLHEHGIAQIPRAWYACRVCGPLVEIEVN